MHHVSRVAVEGFWDTHDFKIQLFPQVTFLIGQNGTGKTTLINLLAAALTADFRTLYRIAFKKITINLDSVDDNSKATITVVKGVKSEKEIETIDYHLKSPLLEHKFSTISSPEPAILRRVNPIRYADSHRLLSNDLSEKLRSIVEVNWISVNRMPILERAPDERALESTVDLRLDNISNRLVRFLSKLSKEKDDEVRKFQESLFISLIDLPKGAAMFDVSALASFDESLEALAGIFEELHVDQARYSSLLEMFKQTGKNIIAKNEGKRRKRGASDITIDDAAFLYGLRRVSDVVDRWYELQKQLAGIFTPREKFLKICNELLQRKQLEISASNELQFKSRTGKPLSPMQLSSGEKQLLILLMETLLQEEKPAVLIADEPELSLHVLWQERLVDSLRTLNPSVQIIAATHSPDIVGRLADRAIDMESVIQ